MTVRGTASPRLRHPIRRRLRGQRSLSWAAMVAALVLAPTSAEAASGPLLRGTAVPLTPSTWSTNPSKVVDAGGVGYFAGDVEGQPFETDCKGCGTPESRRGLFRTDGTTEGTRLVKQLPAAIDPSSLRAVGAHVYFTLTSISTRPEIGGLWSSDGTAEGTRRVWPAAEPTTGNLGVRVIATTTERVLFGAFPDGFRGYGDSSTGTLMSLAPSGGEPATLWSGTLGKDDAWTSVLDAKTDADGVVWLGLPASPGGALTLWRSDGTPEGTRPAGIDGSTAPLAVKGRTVWLLIGRRVVRSDGTPAGTLPPPGFYPDDATTGPERYYTAAVATPGRVFWLSTDVKRPDSARHLWSSDGTTLARISDGVAYADGDGPWQLVALGGRALYVARNPAGVRQLWSSDGVSAPVQLTQSRGTSRDRITGLSAAGGLAYFSVGPVLLATDGTVAGTRVVHDGPRLFGEGRSADFTTVAGRTVFAGEGPETGIELWTADGSPGGTHLVADLQRQAVPGVNVGYAAAVPLGGAAIFTRGGAVPSLWRSDGRTAERLAYLPQSPGYAPPVRSGPYVYLKLQSFVDGGVELWRTDGTPAGTVALTGVAGLDFIDDDLAPRPGGRGVVFTGPGAGGEGSRGLWVSDGTPDSTRRIAELPTGTHARQSFGTDGRRFTAAGGSLFYAVAAEPRQWRLWRSDGTAEGTRVVPGVRGPISARAAVGRRVWFAAPDGARGTQLWSADGAAGAVRRETAVRGGLGHVTAIVAGPGGRVVVAARNGRRSALWATGGRQGAGAGGAALKRLASLPASAEGVRRLGGRVVFVARPGGGRQLWSTDGTAAGTRKLGRFEGVEPTSGVELGGRWYFPTGLKRGELWRTDGTKRGTQRVRLTRGGARLRYAGALTRTGAGLLFAASTSEEGPVQLVGGAPR